MKKNDTYLTRAIIEDIKARLVMIEGYMAWLLTAEQRFRVRQRVEWSRRGRRCGYPRRKIAQRGTVKAVNSFSVTVLLDGYRNPHSFHHAFFNPVSGPKLF